MTKYADNLAYRDVRHCWDALEAKDALITSQAAEIERCHARLEIDHVWLLDTADGEGLVLSPVPVEERANMIDGIECRDVTIKEQDRQIDVLSAEVRRLREALNVAREAIVIALGFIGRDRGTDRFEGTIDQLTAKFAEADRKARAALSTGAAHE